MGDQATRGITLDLPADVHLALEIRARNNRRSKKAEAEMILIDALPTAEEGTNGRQADAHGVGRGGSAV